MSSTATPKTPGDQTPEAPPAAPSGSPGSPPEDSSTTALEELTKSLGTMSERVVRMAVSLEKIAERLAPPRPEQDANVEETRGRVASLRSALLGSNQAARLSAQWDGTQLTAITLNGKAVGTGFVVARQSTFESQPVKVEAAGTAAPKGLDDEPIVSLQLTETENGPVIAYAGPIYKS